MKKKDLINYKGYYGSVHFDSEGEVFFGKIEFIRDLVSYEAFDAKSLIKAFEEAVDDYLQECKTIQKTPDIPFKGSFNVRVEPELHREASLYALSHNETLNGIVNKALSEFVMLHKTS